MIPFSDNFLAAVRTLAGGGPIKKRLIAAYIENLGPMPKFDIPESIRPQFEALWRSMHSARPSTSSEDPVIASVRKMSAAEANRCADSIVTMFSELVCDKATGEPLRIVGPGESQSAVAVEQRKASTLN
jgi:hypothetical protein